MSARGFNIPIDAAFTIPAEKGKNILLFTNHQQWDPGYRKSMTRNLFATIELKLNEKNKGEGRFYEDAQIRLEPQEGKKFTFFEAGRIPAPTDESPNLTTPAIYFRPLGDVNDTEKCENRARKAYLDGKSSRTG